LTTKSILKSNFSFIATAKAVRTPDVSMTKASKTMGVQQILLSPDPETRALIEYLTIQGFILPVKRFLRQVNY